MRYLPPENLDPSGEIKREDYDKDYTTSFLDPGVISESDILGKKKGDGNIDMSDFRRWRDWLLQTEGGSRLAFDGEAKNDKLDANYNGDVESGNKEQLYSRGDFNGDGILDRESTELWPGVLEPRTDLEVLVKSKLWNDPHVEVKETAGADRVR